MKDISILLIAVAIIILAVQIVTEIIKSVFKNLSGSFYNIIVVGVSLFLTIVVVIALSQIFGFALTWYIIIGAIVGAFFIAYGAMYGYDKLFKRVFEAIRDALTSLKSVEVKEDNNEDK